MQISNISFNGAYNPKIIITGGTGYIGANTVKKLASKGFDCVVLGHNLEKRQATIAKLQEQLAQINAKKADKSLCAFANISLEDKQAVDRFFAKEHADAVVHLAGSNSNVESILNPQKYYTNNVTGSINLANSMLEHGTDKIVFASTGSFYENTQNLISENTPITPFTPYAKTKLIVEEMLDSYKQHGLRHTILRLFNTAGVGSPDDTNAGGNLIALIMNRLKTGKDFTLNGSTYPTKDGTRVIDFVHVKDISSAIEAACEDIIEHGENSTYNVGTGKGTSVKEIIKKSEQVSGKKLNYTINNSAPKECAQTVADISKIRQGLGWEPECNIDGIIKDVWAWTEKSTF